MRNTVVMLIVGLIFASAFTVFSPVEIGTASGNTIYVDDSGGADYTTIQDAINAANESDTIYVYSGTYSENIVVNKSLTLSGGGSGSTTINGEGDHALKVTSDNVTISGFKIQNTGGSHACIFLSSVINCMIKNNIVKNGGNGIYLVSSNSNTIKDNTAIEDNNIGIYLSNSDNNIVKNNDIKNNNAYGVWLYASSDNNVIYLNHLLDNKEGNAEDKCSNSWSYDHQGNYWDDYNDYDSDDNGIGDNPYVIDDDSQDDYPLLNPKPVAYIDSISPNQETLIINPQNSQNKKPVAEIVTINPDNADYEESVYFHGLGTDSDGIVIEYKWRSSKDGVLSSESTFTKSDLSVGTHTIYFKVKDDQGEWSSEDSSSLVINPSPTPENEPPTANAGGPYISHVNTSILFDASKSSDPDGDDIVSYAWDFGDGTNGNGMTVEHSYNLSSNYAVKLTISDDQGKTSAISTYANITIQLMNQNGKDSNDEEDDGIPGFEIILIIIAIGVILSKKKHQ